MKNFPLADSSDLLVARLNLASWAQKTFDSYFLDMMYVEFKKDFPLVDSSELLVLDSIRPPEPKNVLFLPSRHDVRRVHEKFSSPDHFGILSERADGCSTHFGPMTQKRLIPTF